MIQFSKQNTFKFFYFQFRKLHETATSDTEFRSVCNRNF